MSVEIRGRRRTFRPDLPSGDNPLNEFFDLIGRVNDVDRSTRRQNILVMPVADEDVSLLAPSVIYNAIETARADGLTLEIKNYPMWASMDATRANANIPASIRNAVGIANPESSIRKWFQMPGYFVDGGTSLHWIALSNPVSGDDTVGWTGDEFFEAGVLYDLKVAIDAATPALDSITLVPRWNVPFPE